MSQTYTEFLISKLEDYAIDMIFGPEHADKRFDEDFVTTTLNIFCFNPLLCFFLCEFHLFATIHWEEKQQEPIKKKQISCHEDQIYWHESLRKPIKENLIWLERVRLHSKTHFYLFIYEFNLK